MTISKIVTAATFIVLTSFAAWGAVGLAAQAPGIAGPQSQATLTSASVEPIVASIGAIDATSDGQAAQPDDGGPATELSIPDDLPPIVLKVEPKVGATDVDPALKEIRVTFSKKMTDKSWSWTEGTKYAFPTSDGEVHYEPDGRTCVMPVKARAREARPMCSV